MSVGALVGQQHIVAQLAAQGVSAQAVALGVAGVPVENQHHRRAVPVVVVPPKQVGAVLGSQMHLLKGGIVQNGGVGIHGVAVGKAAFHITGGGLGLW